MNSTADRLRERSSRAENGCLLWTAGKSKAGYGQLRDNGKTVFAHRKAYELAFGEIPAGMMVCHRCDTPACIEPSHLFLGSQKANMADCAAKNRTSRQFGTLSPRAKLTEGKAREIVVRRMRGEEILTIARDVGIDPTVASRVSRGKAWPHVYAAVVGEGLVE